MIVCVPHTYTLSFIRSLARQCVLFQMAFAPCRDDTEWDRDGERVISPLGHNITQQAGQQTGCIFVGTSIRVLHMIKCNYTLKLKLKPKTKNTFNKQLKPVCLINTDCVYGSTVDVAYRIFPVIQFKLPFSLPLSCAILSLYLFLKCCRFTSSSYLHTCFEPERNSFESPTINQYYLIQFR